MNKEFKSSHMFNMQFITRLLGLNGSPGSRSSSSFAAHVQVLGTRWKVLCIKMRYARELTNSILSQEGCALIYSSWLLRIQWLGFFYIYIPSCMYHWISNISGIWINKQWMDKKEPALVFFCVIFAVESTVSLFWGEKWLAQIWEQVSNVITK